ncbi:hypothetical protein [Streptomyces sp. NBC_00344]|uniref:hypothetical protein n=1 Tax=Streptomyces sp. NBC_00344 TaxID=2975720 RepID=UPI002E23A8AC
MKRAALAACVPLALTLGCSRQHDDERGKADAPVSGRAGEDSAAEIYEFPDGSGSLTTKCVAVGQRAYTTTRAVRAEEDDTKIIPAHQAVVPDPQCTGSP